MEPLYPLSLSEFSKLSYSNVHTGPYPVPNEILSNNPEKGIIVNYGELSAATVEKVIAVLNLNENDVYYELGCGKGRCCFQFFFCTTLQKVVGIEIETRRVNIALNSLEDFKRNKRNGLRRFFQNGREIYFSRDNILNVDFREATIMYTCSWSRDWQEGPLNDYTVRVINHSKNIRYVIALHHMKELKNMHVVKRIKVQSDVYWGELAEYLYIHEKSEGHPFLDFISSYRISENDLASELQRLEMLSSTAQLEATHALLRKEFDEFSTLHDRNNNIGNYLTPDDYSVIQEELGRKKERSLSVLLFLKSLIGPDSFEADAVVGKLKQRLSSLGIDLDTLVQQHLQGEGAVEGTPQTMESIHSDVDNFVHSHPSHTLPVQERSHDDREQTLQTPDPPGKVAKEELNHFSRQLSTLNMKDDPEKVSSSDPSKNSQSLPQKIIADNSIASIESKSSFTSKASKASKTSVGYSHIRYDQKTEGSANEILSKPQPRLRTPYTYEHYRSRPESDTDDDTYDEVDNFSFQDHDTDHDIDHHMDVEQIPNRFSKADEGNTFNRQLSQQSLGKKIPKPSHADKMALEDEFSTDEDTQLPKSHPQDNNASEEESNDFDKFGSASFDSDSTSDIISTSSEELTPSDWKKEADESHRTAPTSPLHHSSPNHYESHSKSNTDSKAKASVDLNAKLMSLPPHLRLLYAAQMQPPPKEDESDSEEGLFFDEEDSNDEYNPVEKELSVLQQLDKPNGNGKGNFFCDSDMSDGVSETESESEQTDDDLPEEPSVDEATGDGDIDQDRIAGVYLQEKGIKDPDQNHQYPQHFQHFQHSQHPQYSQQHHQNQNPQVPAGFPRENISQTADDSRTGETPITFGNIYKFEDAVIGSHHYDREVENASLAQKRKVRETPSLFEKEVKRVCTEGLSSESRVVDAFTQTQNSANEHSTLKREATAQVGTEMFSIATGNETLTVHQSTNTETTPSPDIIISQMKAEFEERERRMSEELIVLNDKLFQANQQRQFAREANDQLRNRIDLLEAKYNESQRSFKILEDRHMQDKKRMEEEFSRMLIVERQKIEQRLADSFLQEKYKIEEERRIHYMMERFKLEKDLHNEYLQQKEMAQRQLLSDYMKEKREMESKFLKMIQDRRMMQ